MPCRRSSHRSDMSSPPRSNLENVVKRWIRRMRSLHAVAVVTTKIVSVKCVEIGARRRISFVALSVSLRRMRSFWLWPNGARSVRNGKFAPKSWSAGSLRRLTAFPRAPARHGMRSGSISIADSHELGRVRPSRPVAAFARPDPAARSLWIDGPRTPNSKLAHSMAASAMR